MDKSAIEKIIEVAEPHIIEENGYKYADKPLNVIAEPQVKTLSLYTLSSLAELLIKEYGCIDPPVIVQVVVKLLGTITEENNTSIADDGFTQTVTVRKGVVLKDNKTVNPRVKLIPYCTFSEVEQPQRDFLLRLDGEGRVSLHEADGGEWKLRARHSIAEKLRELLSGLSDVVVVE